jgi:hypothetical protein
MPVRILAMIKYASPNHQNSERRERVLKSVRRLHANSMASMKDKEGDEM